VTRFESNWGAGTPWSLGVEEELMVLDAETLLLEPAGLALIEEAERQELPGRVKGELFAAVVELNTPVSASAGEALASIRTLRRFAAAAAGERGLAIAAAGTHPRSVPEEQAIADEPRYRKFVEYAGVSARRQGVNGLHVHVGMPDADTCFRALEGVLPWLPVVLALSANSPYLAGVETGLASNRAEVLAQLPRAGAPPAFRSYAEWEAFAGRLVDIGLIPDYTVLWWDIRPHPRFGTLEVRMPDQPTRLERTGAFTALVQALCVAMLEGDPPPSDPGARGIYQQNRWAALRRGLTAELVHPDGTRVAPVAELAEELLELVSDAAGELGTEELLKPFAEWRSEGEEQLEQGRGLGLEAVCARIVQLTALLD
jgi:carboxylate-amine ligase